MAECTCTKTIGEDMAKGQVPKSAAEALAGSGLYKLTSTSIQYLGGVGSRAKTEVGNFEAPQFCPEHSAKEHAPTEGDE